MKEPKVRINLYYMSSTVKIIFPFNLKKRFSFKGRKARFREEPLSSLKSLTSPPQSREKTPIINSKSLRETVFLRTK